MSEDYSGHKIGFLANVTSKVEQEPTRGPLSLRERFTSFADQGSNSLMSMSNKPFTTDLKSIAGAITAASIFALAAFPYETGRAIGSIEKKFSQGYQDVTKAPAIEKNNSLPVKRPMDLTRPT